MKPLYSSFANTRYNSNPSHQSEFNVINMRASMETLLVSHQVALVMNGHVHAYERSVPVAYNQTVANGQAPVYIVIGDGGNREGHAGPCVVIVLLLLLMLLLLLLL